MVNEAGEHGGWLPAAGIALRCVILFIAVVPVPLAIAQELNLSADETTSFLLAVPSCHSQRASSPRWATRPEAGAKEGCYRAAILAT